MKQIQRTLYISMIIICVFIGFNTLIWTFYHLPDPSAHWSFRHVLLFCNISVIGILGIGIGGGAFFGALIAKGDSE